MTNNDFPLSWYLSLPKWDSRLMDRVMVRIETSKFVKVCDK